MLTAVQSVGDPSIHGLDRARTRRTGPVAAATLLLALVGAAASLHLPPGVVSLALVPLAGLTVSSAITGWRTPGTAGPATPVVSWLLIGLAVVVGLPTGWLSWFWAESLTMPSDCAPFVPPDGGDPAHEAHCAATTSAQAAGMIAWLAVIATTALLLVAFVVLAKRSRTAGWAAIPIAIAGSVIAMDLARATALLFGHTTG